MAKLFIVIRRKGSKRLFGAIPTRTSSVKLAQKIARKSLRGGFAFRVVTAMQLKKIISRLKPRGGVIRKVKRKKIRMVRRRRVKRVRRRKARRRIKVKRRKKRRIKRRRRRKK